LFLLKRNLIYFWRTNAAVVAGVAVAVAVLAGALIVGDSVRTSLRNIFLQRLGNTSHVINSSNFFREKLSEDVSADERFASAGFENVCPIIVLEGAVTNEKKERRSARVRVYGVDERFWKFHQRHARPMGDRDALSSPGLARELEAKDGDALLLRVSMPSAIPLESLHSRKEDTGRTLRLNLQGILPADEEGEFSVNPQQTATRAVFVSLQLLQRELEQPAKANTLLVSEKTDPANTAVLEQIVRDKSSLEDMGVRLRILNEQAAISIETESAIISDPLASTARVAAAESGSRTMPVLSYLANSIRSGNEIPYSLVTSVDDESFARLRSADSKTGTVASPSTSPPLILNEWAARELKVTPGAEVTLDYYLWQPDGTLATKTAHFSLVAVVPIAGIAADRELVPEYPGITESESIADWDPPFPVDLSRVAKRDEDYWKQYRTTPKAFISISSGQELWGTRFGKLTSLRVIPPAGTNMSTALDNYQNSLKAKLDPTQMGLVVFPARAGGLEASKGATDFGEYFLYFSFFLVVSALMLAVLFFKLGVEQRLREIGTLQAIGFSMSKIRRMFLSEGLLLSAIGSLLGLGLALAYGKLMIFGLTTWWVDAVGTTALRLHVSLFALLIGAAGGIVAALLCIAVTLRGLRKTSTRSLLHGVAGASSSSLGETSKRAVGIFRLRWFFPIFFGTLGLAFVLLAMFGVVGKVAGFFGGGTLVLVALLSYQWTWLRRDRRKAISGNGWLPVVLMGLRNASSRPARSVLCISLIASAAFIIVAVDAFRRDPKRVALDKNSGSGGFVLLGEADLPIVYDPNTEAGREALNLTPDQMANVSITRFRLRPGDDASCLNLYQPRNPRILGATEEFIRSNRFAFQSSIATSAEEKANPWLLLNRDMGDGVVPVIADANSMTYVLHRKLSDEMSLDQGSGPPLRLRFVGALSDSLFQSELVMSEKNFLRVFPGQQGYRVFLVEAPANADSAAIAGTLEDRLSDFGFDAVPTAERLAEFHRVENTYLSTFQMLGGLGLALGTLGLGAVLLRNVLERKRELALLRAVGYNRKHLAVMVVAENAFLLFSGLLIGFESAMLAIAPVTYERGGAVPYASLGTLLLVVAVAGLVASLIATAAVIRSPLIPALKEE
jgi:ABC-type antimicrobial peptide transport system permease subunit